MGGVLVLIGIAVSTLLWADWGNRFIWIVLLVTLGYGAIGWVDDYRKVVHRDPKGMATMLKRALAESLRQFQGMKTSELQARRHERLMAYGKFKETEGR